MGQIGRLDLAHAEVEGVVDLVGAGLGAVSAGGAVRIDVPGRGFERNVVITGSAGNRFDRGEGVGSDLAVVFDALEVNLKAACRGTKFGEILIELGYPAAEIGVFLDEKNVIADFRSLESSGETADTAAHDQYRTIACSVTHAKPP